MQLLGVRAIACNTAAGGAKEKKRGGTTMYGATHEGNLGAVLLSSDKQ